MHNHGKKILVFFITIQPEARYSCARNVTLLFYMSSVSLTAAFLYGSVLTKQHNFGDCCSHVLALEPVNLFTSPDLDNFDTEVSWRWCMERDFQDGATGINKVAFCNVCDEKEARKGGEINAVYTIFPPPPRSYLLLFSFFSLRRCFISG